MAIGIDVQKKFSVSRCETRIPMEIGVQINGHAIFPGTEHTFAENVSSRGARVLSTRRWKVDDRLILTTLAGSFRAVARVAYCRGVNETGFAIGLELVERTGNWIVAAPTA